MNQLQESDLLFNIIALYIGNFLLLKWCTLIFIRGVLKLHEYPQGLVASACLGGTGGLIARSDIWTLLELIREMCIFDKITRQK